ncbi:hypothetical protein [Candidatus Villigracilis affinis]|nr:hypothetical protein [Anaerolineales bacterium]
MPRITFIVSLLYCFLFFALLPPASPTVTLPPPIVTIIRPTENTHH